MATFAVRISRIPSGSGGPYAYFIGKDGLGVKELTGLATFALAFNGARDDIAAAMPPGETPTNVMITVQTGL